MWRTASALVRGAAVEAAWTGLHAALWPFGFVATHTDPRPFAPAPADDGDVPVLLVHGFGDNRSIFAVLRRALRRRGFRQVVTMNYGLLTNDVRGAAAVLGAYVERLCVMTGHRRIRLVGHSLGGLIARYYVQRLGGDGRVDVLVTLGSPHGGTHLARLFPVRLGRQLRPGSRLLHDLAGPTDCATRFVAVWSPVDEIVVPGRSARLDHPDLDCRSVEVPAVGHQALLVHPAVLTAVYAALAPGRADEGAVTL